MDKKILIINPFGIGDVLFTTPVIRAIKEQDPNTGISYWCNQRAAEVLENNPRLDKIFHLSRGDLKKILAVSKIAGFKKFLGLISSLRKEKFDLALDFSLDHRYGLIAKIAGIKRRVGYNYKKRGWMLTEKIDITGYSDKHAVEWYLDLLKFLPIESKSSKLELFVPEAAKIDAWKILSGAGFTQGDLIAAIAPGGGESWGKDACMKLWPPDKFACLIDKLADKLGAKIIILGDNSEKYIIEAIKASVKNKFFDLSGKTNLKQLAAIISSVKLLISNDGGPMHMASALGVKTVSMFGPTDELVYGPYPASDINTVIKSGVSCRPCYRNFRLPRCQNNLECMNAISVDVVFNAAGRLLQ